MDHHKVENIEYDAPEERSFLKMKAKMEKDGYREGIEEGRTKVFQQYFDEGYKEGFKNGFELGQLKGALRAESILNQIELCQVKELEKSSTGACILCRDEKNMSLPTSLIKLNQTEILQTFKENVQNK